MSRPDASQNEPARAANHAELASQVVEISEIAGGLAHEIRNPLSTLKVNLQLLDEDWRQLEAPPEAASIDPREVARRSRRRLRTLLDESSRLERILDDFLQFVRRREIEAAPHDVNRVLAELADFYRPQAESHRIRLTLEPAAGPLLAMLDPPLFKSAVLNLLINAQQAMPEGGEVRLRTSRDPDGDIRIDVADSGPGIPPDQRSDVFRAYFSTKRGGSGLGLAQTRRTILQHGGRISLEPNPDCGACFTLTLPAAGVPDRDAINIDRDRDSP